MNEGSGGKFPKGKSTRGGKGLKEAAKTVFFFNGIAIKERGGGPGG